MVGAVPGQLDALAAHLQGVAVGECHLRHRPCRVVIAKQPAGLLVPDPHNVLEQRGSTERTESSADRCQAQAARRAISRWDRATPRLIDRVDLLVPSHVATLDLQALVPRPAAAAWQQAQGLLHNRAHRGPGTARVRENRKPISVDELFMADRDLTEPPPPLEE